MTKNGIWFWQPTTDYLKIATQSVLGRRLVIIANYLIWLFLFFISYRLIRFSANLFWQILVATIIAEIIERTIKSRVSWKRPLFERKDLLPGGLVKSWYQSGSFPSGHTSKAVFFFLMALQYSIINPFVFIVVTVPLLLFRVLVGFHYPIDMIGGVFVGLFSWLIVHQITFPPFLVESIHQIFNIVFFIH